MIGINRWLALANGIRSEWPDCDCCDVAVAQINYPSFKHNTQDSIEQARGRSHEEVSSQIFMLYVM
jgi:hypothetical protein